jgi:xanthine phosphoribosyltransferase
MRPPTFEEITARLAKWDFPAGVDGVIGIASGGVVPAALVAQRLGVGLKTIRVTYRDPAHGTRFNEPQLASEVPGLGLWKRVLLVDDRYVSGRSWNAARAMLPKHAEVLPFVLSGDAPFALFRDKTVITDWPWSAE